MAEDTSCFILIGMKAFFSRVKARFKDHSECHNLSSKLRTSRSFFHILWNILKPLKIIMTTSYEDTEYEKKMNDASVQVVSLAFEQQKRQHHQKKSLLTLLNFHLIGWIHCISKVSREFSYILLNVFITTMSISFPVDIDILKLSAIRFIFPKGFQLQNWWATILW